MSKNWIGNKVLVKNVEKQRQNLKWWQLKEAQHSMHGKSFSYQDQNYDSANKQGWLDF